MLRSCKYCGHIHEKKYNCGKKPLRRNRDKKIDMFYNSGDWQRKRAKIRQRDLNLCQVCLSNYKYTFHGLEVHHIVPLKEDFEQRCEDSNLITLCGHCHERAERLEINRETLHSLIKQ